MFSIFRSDEATAPLQQTWELADEALRAAIVRASARIDQRLQRRPHAQGESRAGGERIIFEAPLAATFEVDDQSQLVRIVRTWVYSYSGAWKPDYLE